MATKEKPILFSGAMVRAILGGRKTMTRRLVKLPNPKLAGVPTSMEQTGDGKGWIAWYDGAGFNAEDTAKAYPTGGIKAPYAVGDLLWVREAWGDTRGTHFDKPCYYRADVMPGSDADTARINAGIKWKPSRFMPRWASRLALRAVEVRKPERIQDIPEGEAYWEGVERLELSPRRLDFGAGLEEVHPMTSTYRASFAGLWNQIHGAGAWERNEWVWPIRFEVVRIDGKEKVR